MTIPLRREPSSFRDPSGFIFHQDGRLYRQINKSYQDDYKLLKESGLYDHLVKTVDLIPHTETELDTIGPDGFIVIEPKPVPFISYPYEWSFYQLKQAALTTLRILKESIERGMILKDASAYNIQFVGGKPLLIDTLSFEKLDDRKPWVAYKQFCQHFLAPLALAAKTDIRLTQLLRVYLDGIPLDLASSLLPGRTKFSFGLLTHIHMHAKSQIKHAGKKVANVKGGMNRRALLGLVDSLTSCCSSLTWSLPDTTWGDYYNDTNYSEQAATHKEQLVRQFAEKANPQHAWDLGANDGRYSRILAESGAYTIAFDIDPVAVEKNARTISLNGDNRLLPLMIDLTNPSPGLGWANSERVTLKDRGPTDLVMALALVHHLAIGNNLPLELIAQYFASLGDWLIIEFVPKDDSQTQRLLAAREDIFIDYTLDKFEQAFANFFELTHKELIVDSARTLYLMKRKS